MPVMWVTKDGIKMLGDDGVVRPWGEHVTMQSVAELNHSEVERRRYLRPSRSLCFACLKAVAITIIICVLLYVLMLFCDSYYPRVFDYFSKFSTGFIHSPVQRAYSEGKPGALLLGYPLLQKSVHRTIHRECVCNWVSLLTLGEKSETSTGNYYYYGYLYSLSTRKSRRVGDHQPQPV
jgi:hypothetical protein